MNLKALWRPFLLYTCLLGPLTVGAVHLATDSGFFVLFSAAGGLLLVVLGVGATGPSGVGGVETADGAEVGVDDTGVLPRGVTSTSSSLVYLCYGSGVFLWSLVVLYAFYNIA
ncbi:hypothetical protein B4589_010620 [Halolamina sp. CBA1230]|uniref:hypothetical protein n=1 Tax=Halolamina sp. CBA1230 TaxID=1853690 RepID=UPI0009A1830D|nr:hypothetical protein [Halolamina sp. CBA1230]QKY20809.1 hypothetical protein B4589_010620 [Halolamina sp. CBA1230]